MVVKVRRTMEQKVLKNRSIVLWQNAVENRTNGSVVEHKHRNFGEDFVVNDHFIGNVLRANVFVDATQKEKVLQKIIKVLDVNEIF